MRTSGMKETMDALRQETAGETASPAVRAALVAELGRRRPAERRWWQAASLRWWPAAAMACLAAGFWFGTNRTREIPPVEVAVVNAPALQSPVAAVVPGPAVVEESVEPAPRPAARRAGLTPAVEYAAVTPWYFHAGLPTPATARVVRMEVNAATAQQFGVYSSGKTADAEILMGDDGLARAIRFLGPVRRNPVVRASSRQEF